MGSTIQKKGARRICAAVAGLAISVQSHAITGIEYRELNPVQRTAWVVGALDGFMVAQLSATNKEPELSKCLAGVHPTQIHAMFEKELEADPRIWHFPAAFQLFQTLNGFCKSGGR
jgi:hypothetical protein